MEMIISYLKQKIYSPTFWQWFFLIAVIIIFHASHGIDSDEGVVLDGAWNIMNGQVPYLNFFEFIPPGSFYLISGVWKLFGISYLAAKVISMAVLLLGSIGIYKIAKQFLQNKTLTYLPALFFVISSAGWPLINHNFYNAIVLIWASYFFLLAARNNKIINYFWSGLLMGTSFLFLQQKTIAVFATLLMFILLDHIISSGNKKIKSLIKIITLFAGGFALPCLWLLHWPLSIIWNDLYEFPTHHYLSTNRISPWLFLIFFLCFALIITLIKSKAREIYLLSAIQLALLLASLSRPDYQHLSQGYFITYILFVISINQANKKMFYNIFPLTIITLIICFNAYTLLSYTLFYSLSSWPILKEIKSQCHSSYLYAGPFLPGMYFETRKLNATSYPILITGQQTEAQFMIARKQIEDNKPDCAITNYEMPALNGHDRKNPVDELITNNYHEIYTEDKTTLYKINP